MADDLQLSATPLAPSTPEQPNPNPLASIPGDPLDTAGAERLSQSAQQLKSLATSGGFAINEAGLQHYTKVCDDYLNGLSDLSNDLFLLSREAKMGGGPYAKEIASFSVKISDGDPQALIPNLQLLKDSFAAVKDALTIANKNYRAADDAHSQVFQKLEGPES
ncbi:hypothetical protein VSH64_32400 [Amycolatopsis rhabdoformis]|uniref:ESX-1 secretion-associated protein n=1 Tax=Amycolatopsis rhabdoformis TaxID=1448059 RepID=A0ABZ1I1T5_9PSEU|nr:hypothetical protein [Amycolatopsis rhabdoformis]WSE27533.1 hypothetical protein VSH64_32400 [Amycolatopsis rhabdoformis]